MPSSLSSKFSTLTGRTIKNDTVTTLTTTPQLQSNDLEHNELNLETFISNLQLHKFFELTEKDQIERLADIDVLELFRALQAVNRQLGMVQLENYFLIDFLQKNDSKLLIGLEKHRSRFSLLQRKVLRPDGKSSSMSMAGISASSSIGLRSRSVLSKSFKDSLSMGSQKKLAYEYKLNFEAKAEMAEKLAADIEKKLDEMQASASQDMKLLRAQMEEIKFVQIETQETALNFELHFLHNESDINFLHHATENQLARKIKKFFNNWIKNAHALLGTMRLKITTVQERCHKLRNELLTKADLSGILTPIDFEKLIIKRRELLNFLEEKSIHMNGLKGITGRAALSMAEEKQIMTNIEEESKQFNNKTIEVVKAISKLEKEAAVVEKENVTYIVELEHLRTQLEHFEAPSVIQYIEKKDDVLALEKEEKMLRRKIHISQMKLDNLQKKQKRKNDLNMFINIID